MKILVSICLALLALLAMATGVPAAPKLHLSTSTFSRVISPGWTTLTLPCNGAILNVTTFMENLTGRDVGSSLFRVDTIAPTVLFLYENLSYTSIGQIWCLHGFALVDSAVAFSYSGSLTTRILTSGNYTLAAQILFSGAPPFSSSTRLSESWTSTVIV